MSDQLPHEDTELADQIRRSMAHYTFDGPLPAGRAEGQAWRWPVLAGAVLAGGVAATLVISLLGGLPRGPVGNRTPEPSPSAGVGSPGPSAQASPTNMPITELEAAAACLGKHDLQDSWVRPDERPEDVAQRLSQLPLIHTETKSGDAFFVYADDRFNVLCELTRAPDGTLDSSIFTGLREPHGGGLEYSGGGTSPGSVEPTGPLPDMFMYGTAAPRFVRVEIILADGGAVPAWIGDGMWLGWWKDPISSVAIRGYDRSGNVTTLEEGLRFVPIEPEETPAPTPWPGLPTDFSGVRDACGSQSFDVPAEWVRAGEQMGQLVQRINSLPLVNVDIRDHAASYLFADERFVVDCRIYRTATTDPDSTLARSLREDPGTGLVYTFGSAVGAGGGPTGTWPADLLMVGSAAERFEQIEVVLEDGTTVPATLTDGMWLAWWNKPVASVEVRGYDAKGQVTIIDARLEIARSPDE